MNHSSNSHDLPDDVPEPDSSRRLFELGENISPLIYIGAGFTFVGLFILAWTLVTETGLVSPIFLPSPTMVWQEFIRQVETNVLWYDIAISTYRILVGWLLSILFALPIGTLMGSFKFFEGLFEPFIDLVRYMPAVAFIPLTILWVGVGDSQKFVIIFIGTFFQQVLMIMDNVKTVPREFIHVGYTLGLSKSEILRLIVLPSAFPGIWDTLRITLGWAWTYLVLAELVAASSGLGYRIMRAQRFLQTDAIVLGIMVMGVLGLVSDYIFKWSYRILFPWTKQGGSTS